MRFIWQPQPQVVLSGSWRISRRGRSPAASRAWVAAFSPLAFFERLLRLDLGGHRRQVGCPWSPPAGSSARRCRPRLGGELQPLEDRHLVRELVDDRLLERDLGARGTRMHLAQLLRIQRVEVFGDHGDVIVPKRLPAATIGRCRNGRATAA
jgi:hypothetical protein